MYLLLDAVPEARIFSYGYDSRTHASTPVSNQFIWQHGQALIADLTLQREETQACPGKLSIVQGLANNFDVD